MRKQIKFINRNILLTILTILFLIFASIGYAQESPLTVTEMRPGTIRPRSDKGKNYYKPQISSYKIRNSEHTSIVLQMPILGKVSNVADTYGARIIVSEDVIIMSLRYQMDEHLCNKNVYTSIEITAYTTENNKYKNNHKFTVYSDNKLLLSKDMELRSAIGVGQKLTMEIKPENFMNMIKAQNPTLQLADTKINLQEKESKALSELSDLVTPLTQKKPTDEELNRCSRAVM